jgi:hypothetical protein
MNLAEIVTIKAINALLVPFSVILALIIWIRKILALKDTIGLKKA